MREPSLRRLPAKECLGRNPLPLLRSRQGIGEAVYDERVLSSGANAHAGSRTTKEGAEGTGGSVGSVHLGKNHYIYAEKWNRLKTVPFLRMGAWASTPELLPETLPADVIQAILERTPTSVLLDKALLVSKKWKEIGRRNVIWIPRYEKLTGIKLNPVHYAEHQVFKLFLEKWLSSFQVWTSNQGRNIEIINAPKGMSWIDTEIPLNQDEEGVLGRYIVIIDDAIIAVPGLNYLNLGEVFVLITIGLKHPKLLKITRELRQPTQLEYVPLTVPYLVHDMDNLDLLGAKLLGKGGYNCVFESNDGKSALRISPYKNPQLRGAYIANFFQSFIKTLLGPSMVIETQPPRRETVLDKEYSCPKLDNADPPFLIQGLELLETKHETYPEMTKAEIFSLIWFFYTARTAFVFRHGDFKTANMGYRFIPSPETLTFRMGDEFYQITLDKMVPVVIDFDFSSVFVTREKIYYIGSPQGAPPEALLELIDGKESFTPYNDWWSVGIVIWEGVYEIVEEKTLEESFQKYFNLVELENKTQKNVKNAIRWIFYYSFYQSMIGNSPIPKNATHYLYTDTRGEFLEKTFPAESSPSENAALLRRLLSWNPKERDFNGNPWKIISTHFQDFKVSSAPLVVNYAHDKVSDVYFPRDESIRREMEVKYEQLKQLVY